MTAAQRMELLHRRLANTAADAEVRLLAEDQILVSRNLVRNPDFARGGKAATYVPGPDGYEVYVSCRPAEVHAREAARSQRMTGPSYAPPAWDGQTMRLRLDPPATSDRWTVQNGHAEIVSVHATAGSSEALDQVHAILSDVEAVLLT